MRILPFRQNSSWTVVNWALAVAFHHEEMARGFQSQTNSRWLNGLWIQPCNVRSNRSVTTKVSPIRPKTWSYFLRLRFLQWPVWPVAQKRSAMRISALSKSLQQWVAAPFPLSENAVRITARLRRIPIRCRIFVDHHHLPTKMRHHRLLSLRRPPKTRSLWRHRLRRSKKWIAMPMIAPLFLLRDVRILNLHTYISAIRRILQNRKIIWS